MIIDGSPPIRRAYWGFAVPALLATAAVASASVVANPDGSISVGKGDVQTALGYGSGNDAAFQADAAAQNITFSRSSDKVEMIADVDCAPISDTEALDMSQVHGIQVDVGGYATSGPASFTAKSTNGKVTGYTVGAISGAGTMTSAFDFSKITTSCGTGSTSRGTPTVRRTRGTTSRCRAPAT
jgi:hypothetical protein